MNTSHRITLSMQAGAVETARDALQHKTRRDKADDYRLECLILAARTMRFFALYENDIRELIELKRAAERAGSK